MLQNVKFRRVPQISIHHCYKIQKIHKKTRVNWSRGVSYPSPLFTTSRGWQRDSSTRLTHMEKLLRGWYFLSTHLLWTGSIPVQNISDFKNRNNNNFTALVGQVNNVTAIQQYPLSGFSRSRRLCTCSKTLTIEQDTGALPSTENPNYWTKTNYCKLIQ